MNSKKNIKKKNLLYVFADQWRKTAMGIEGEAIESPSIDNFANQSLVFDNAISSYPLCSPHRAALLTGKYPYSCGMWTNCKIGLDEVLMLKPQEVCIGDVLKQAGYQTAYIGKWHLDASEMNFYEQPKSKAINWDAYTPKGERRAGFDYWFSYGAMDNHLSPHYWRDSDEQLHFDDWSVAVETREAINYLENRDKQKPFCLFLSWNPPHPPYDQVPDKFLNKYEKISKFRENVPKELRDNPEYLEKVRQYYAAITGVDHYFKQLLDYLENADLVEDTVIVLSADHGDMMGSQGLMGKNIWYEESINIPLMIKASNLPKGHVDVLLSSMDQMPTLLDLLEVDIPDTVQGQSKLKVINGSEEDVDCVFLSMIPGMPDLIEPYRKRGLNNKAFGWRGLRFKDRVYVVDNGCEVDFQQKIYYYDLKADPYQLKPEILKKDDDRVVECNRMLRKFLDKIKDPFLLGD